MACQFACNATSKTTATSTSSMCQKDEIHIVYLHIIFRGFMLGITSQVLNAHVHNLLWYHALLEKLCNEANVTQSAHLGSPSHRLLLLLRHLLDCLEQ